MDGIAGEVKVYRLSDRTLIGIIGAGEFSSLAGIAVDPSRREVLVSDYGSVELPASVEIFSYHSETSGNFVGAISGAGSGDLVDGADEFSRPRGLATEDSQIFLTDALRGQILVFRRDGLVFSHALGNPDLSARDLRVPSDVAVNAEGKLFVTGTRASSIVAFE